VAYLKEHRSFHAPKASRAEKRQAWFQVLVHETLRRADCRVTSTPNADVYRIEVTEGSPWPAELAARGYPLERDEPPVGERIVAHMIREPMMISSSGAMVAESTRVTMVLRHPGIMPTVRYRFPAP
jgi:hypothetical protein